MERAAGRIPKTISCRYNPGGVFKISNDIMDNPGDSKYGMTTDQIFEAFRILKEKGAENFGIHAFLASNTVTNEYYPMPVSYTHLEGPDLIYLPEIPFDVEKFLAKVKDLLTKKDSVVIAVSEGIKLADGR